MKIDAAVNSEKLERMILSVTIKNIGNIVYG
jgi:hypothetical protein